MSISSLIYLKQSIGQYNVLEKVEDQNWGLSAGHILL